MFKTTEGSLRAFSLVWLGQLISLVGTRMTFFALLVWIWDQTGEVTPIALIGVLSAIPGLVVTFFAGSLADRWNRQHVMIVGDLVAGLTSIAVFLLYNAGELQIWHLTITSIIAGAAGTFQGLAYSTSLTLMIPKAHYARACGLISLGDYASQVGAPLLAGLLVTVVGIGGILLIDLVTFFIAVGLLFLVRIPQPPIVEEVRKSLWRDALLGYQYIIQRPGLLGLMLITLAFAFAESLAFPLIAPMILARTGSDEFILGTVMAVQGAGGIVGSLVLLAWGGPKRRIHGVLLGALLTGLLGDALMGFGQSLPVWIVAAVGIELFIPMMFGSYYAIWQSKVEPAMQGRVFAARGVVTSVGEPVARLASGVLVDTISTPAMMAGGSLAPIFGPIVGTGPGAGIGLVIIFGGLLTALAGGLGYLSKSVREVESQLPDVLPDTPQASETLA